MQLFDALVVCGDRRATLKEWGEVVGLKIAQNLVFGGILIHGAARGIDTISQEVTEGMDRYVERYHAQWDEFGKAAGPRRNCVMRDRLLEIRDKGKTVGVFAFHNDIASSKGTRHMATLARKAKIPLTVFDVNGKAKEY